MERAAKDLRTFEHGDQLRTLTFNIRFPHISCLAGEDFTGALVASMYYWREHKPAPLIKNLINNSTFRSLVKNITHTSGDDWYPFISRSTGEDGAADLKILQTYYKSQGTLVQGSNTLALQEPCLFCEVVMPGLCFAKVRRKTGESQQCFACPVDETLFAVTRASHLVPYPHEDKDTTIGDEALRE